MDRAYSILDVKSVDLEKRTITGVATTPTPDRLGDIVEPLGVQFKNPLPLLHQHDREKPVGLVKFDKPTKDGITFTATLAAVDEPPSLKNRVDTAWGEIKSGLVRAVSIGFKPLEYSRLEEGGLRFLRSEVLELSLVTIPAQADATIETIKSLDQVQLAAAGRALHADPLTPPASRKTKPVRALEGPKMKRTFAEQIASFEATRAAKIAEMDKLMEGVADKGLTLDAAQKETYDTLEAEVDEIDDHLKRLRASEKRNAAAAVVVDQTPTARATVPAIALAPKLDKGIGFVRLFAAKYIAKQQGRHPAEVAQQRGWGDDIVGILRAPIEELVQRAAVAVGTTTDPAWAGPLVNYQNLVGEFIALLSAQTVVNRIPGLRRVPFNIKVPREITAASANWTGEGKPKPVSAMAFDSVTLSFAKIAGIVPITQELMRFSSPSAEALIRDSLSGAIAKLIDTDFLNPAKALVAGVSPASITNGVVAIPASGTTADAFRTDFAAMLSAFTAAGITLSGLVVAMQATQALMLGLMRNAFGAVEFPGMDANGGSVSGVTIVASQNVPTGLIVAMNAPDILLADDGSVDFDVSTEASLQLDSAPVSPPIDTTVYMSLWQNNMVGIRAERFINWLKARTGSVQLITGANYH